MTDLLLILLPSMMKFSKSPLIYWYLLPLALVGFAADIIMNNTTIPIFLDKAWFEEWTFSTRLERLCALETTDPGRKMFYIAIALEVNRVAGFTHIKAVEGVTLCLK
jgi:hypothetical protein